MTTFDKEPKKTTSNIKLCFSDNICIQPTIAHKSPGLLILDSVLTHQECKTISQIQTTLAPHSKKNRKKYVFNFNDLSKIIIKRCGKYIPISEYLPGSWEYKSNNKSHHKYELDWKFSHINDCWRLVKCSSGSQIGMHLDSSYVQSVDCKSIYTIMVYLTDNFDGATQFNDNLSCSSRIGRVIIFNQNKVHFSKKNSHTKCFIRSEIMFRRSVETETPSDREAMNIYLKGQELNKHEFEKMAFKISPKLENLFYI